ncbi:Tautomerase/MIF superfamily [Aspergillus multicolor]|uniref:MIF domain protein n=1 Tax=Aspergillus multicolor TaxID=41759 RepID=UPI003CCD0C77
MPQRRRRIDLSLLRRRQILSSASSSELSPEIPVLQSPISFHAMALQQVSEATLKQSNKLNRAPVKPSMFFDDKEEDDDGTVPKTVIDNNKDVATPQTPQKAVGEESSPKNQYLEGSFNTRLPWASPIARIGQDSYIVIEVKLNTCVEDEDAVISRITTRMAQIYQRSEFFMFVSIQVVPSLRFGNSTVPAYSMKVFALPYLIAPITNLRSTILIQAALQDILHCPPARGIILYIPVAEENMATNNTTMMGEIARLQDDRSRGREPGFFQSLSRTLSRRKKSSSGVSAPLSVATTSSWAEEAKPAAISESEGTTLSVDESLARRARPKNRTLRLFASRRTLKHSDHSARSMPGE